MATLHVELSDSAYAQLTAMAEAQRMAPSEIIESLWSNRFEFSDAQMRQVDRAIEELDRGEVASDEEAKTFFAHFAR